MSQTLPNREGKPDFWSMIGGNLGQGFSQGIASGMEAGQKLAGEERKAQNEQRLAQQKVLDDINKMQMEYDLKRQLEEGKIDYKNQGKKNFFQDVVDKFQQTTNQKGKELQGLNQPNENNGLDLTNISPEMILAATTADKDIGTALQQQQKAQQSKFSEDRKYHTGLAAQSRKQADELRTSLPKKEMALNFARDAIQTGDLGFFSKDRLADATGIDLFRTSKGAQLVTAGKENLLSNMGRVSARAQNIWFEQRLNSMFGKIGQSQEANLTVQEMLEGEVEMDKAYLDEYDRIVEEDKKKYGFELEDASKRARKNVQPLEKQILQRTTYRMKEIEEVETGLNKLKEKVGKNVSKGTPLTMAMAKLYKDKYKENALDVAKKNGYYVPTLEEFRVFRSNPQENRKENIE